MKNLVKQKMEEKNYLERELGQLLQMTLEMECELYSVIGSKKE
jgi:hypothetical protein